MVADAAENSQKTICSQSRQRNHPPILNSWQLEGTYVPRQLKRVVKFLYPP